MDEIPNPALLRNLKINEKLCFPWCNSEENTPMPKILVLIQDFYYYNITCKVMEFWNFAKILKYEYYKTKMESSPQKVRTIHLPSRATANFVSSTLHTNDSIVQINTEDSYTIEKGGWHLSYFDTAENIKLKLESFSHQEFNNHIFSNLDYIRSCITNKKSLYNRTFDKIVYIPIKENLNLPPLYEVFFEFS